VAASDFAAVEKRVREALESGPYVLGEQFSAADVLLASMFLFSRELSPKGPAIDAYMARITARPAFQRAQAKDEP
jgi:glutathione S-transferase